MKPSLTPLLLLASALAGLHPALHAQILFTGNYSENFDTLSSSVGVPQTWTDNTTLLGWHAPLAPTYTPGTGSDGTANFYALGVAGAGVVEDRALGWRNGGAVGEFRIIGLRLTNSTGLTLSSFDVSYRGEQWQRNNSAFASTLRLQYSVNALSADDSAATWTEVAPLQYTGPLVGPSAVTAIDGNATGNFALLSAAGLATNWLPGTDLWMRWVSTGISGADHLVAVDDVAVSAIPEPSSSALLVAAGLLGFAGLRRRMREA
jgi:hypothetical protein